MQRRIKAERHILIFVAIWRDHAPNHRCCRYLAWTRSFGWVQAKPDEHILSLFCVITLIWPSCYHASVISGKSGEADSVAILRDHAPNYNFRAHFVDFRLTMGSRSCRYFAWSRSFGHPAITLQWFPANRAKQILSLFCVITLPIIILVDFRLNINRRCCRYNAPKRSVCWFS